MPNRFVAPFSLRTGLLSLGHLEDEFDRIFNSSLESSQFRKWEAAALAMCP